MPQRVYRWLRGQGFHPEPQEQDAVTTLKVCSFAEQVFGLLVRD